MRARSFSMASLQKEVGTPQDHAVHVWHVRATEMLSRLGRFTSWLSPREAARAGRFRFEKDRVMYLTAHGALRDILAKYLGARPESVELDLAESGKPLLAGKHARSSLAFNMSHSGNLILVAVVRGRKIGVDVEEVRPGFDWESVARFVLPMQTVEDLKRQPADLRLAQFLGAWTAVEALAKARGGGLKHPALGPESRLPWPLAPRPADPALGEWDRSAWWLYSLELPEGYVGSVVVEEMSMQRLVPPQVAPGLTTRACTFSARGSC